MHYENIHFGRFIDRSNRFIAHVEIDGVIETVHVKNTGRCKELLLPGAEVSVQYFDNPKRKTAWDLIAVRKEKLGWVNIDSQASNKVVEEWLRSPESPFANAGLIKPEYSYGKSRIDFYLEIGSRKILMEVKGCTLEVHGKGYFPDAPTLRGAKHLEELSGAVSRGYEACLVYCISMPEVSRVYPNIQTDPGYASALEEAKKQGMKIFHLTCEVTPDSVKAESFSLEQYVKEGEENDESE